MTSKVQIERTEAPAKLNKMERIKKEKNPFEVWDDIERYAETGELTSLAVRMSMVLWRTKTLVPP